MACISCGVITSAWLCRNSSLCVSAMLRCNIGPVLAYPFTGFLYTRPEYELPMVLIKPRRYQNTLTSTLHPELLSEIQPADFRVVDDVVGAALAQHLARIDDVCAVGEAERLAALVGR